MSTYEYIFLVFGFNIKTERTPLIYVYNIRKASTLNSFCYDNVLNVLT